MFQNAAIRWTARLFVACYAGRVCLDVARRTDPGSQRLARWIWTGGCLMCLVHFAVSFHFEHHWSHSAAYDHVLRRTQHATGLATGIGLYVNYLFAVVWTWDCIQWWRNLEWPRQRILYWIVQALFAFLIFQATAVFGPTFWWPVAISFLVLTTVLRQVSQPRSTTR